MVILWLINPLVMEYEWLVGGLEQGFYDFPIILGMSSSQLTNSYFSEGLVYHQPDGDW